MSRPPRYGTMVTHGAQRFNYSNRSLAAAWTSGPRPNDNYTSDGQETACSWGTACRVSHPRSREEPSRIPPLPAPHPSIFHSRAGRTVILKNISKSTRLSSCGQQPSYRVRPVFILFKIFTLPLFFPQKRGRGFHSFIDHVHEG